MQRKNEAIWDEKHNHWRIRVQRDGERKSFYSSLPGKKGKIEAERKADEWLLSGAGKDVRFKVLWLEYLESIDKSNGSEHYVKQEQLGRLWLLPKLEHKYVSRITLNDMQDCVNAPYVQKKLSKKTCENVRGVLTAVYRYAFKRRAPMQRPEFLTVPKGAKKGVRKILQPNALKTLFTEDWVTPNGKRETAFYIHAWRFIVLSGLRRGELAGLMRDSVDGNILYIKRSINSLNEKTLGKNENAQRYIVLSPRMLQVLKDQAAHIKRNGIISPWLFPSPTGDMPKPNNITDGWRTYRKVHGIDCSLHELRHTMISVSKADVPEQLIKGVVGHSVNMDTFGVYGHEVDGEMERASKLIADVFERLLE